MSPLADRRFLKMHGAGNAIVVLDLRGSQHRVAPEEARAIAADAGSRFDQLMVVHDPVSPGTDAYMRIYNTDGSVADITLTPSTAVGGVYALPDAVFGVPFLEVLAGSAAGTGVAAVITLKS